MKLARPQPPRAVRWIVHTLEQAGFETWAVGGAVRDELLGIASMDWDLATRARPGEVRRAFRRTVPVGIEHGTVGVLSRDGTLYEVTTFRKDVETFGRRAAVEFADTLDDDLARRDFTINAVAWHPLRDELRDPWGGVQDMRDRVLRTVGEPAERFAEDHLRILRALRFAGRFGMTVEDATWRALCAAAHRLPSLSPERVREELIKILETEQRPSRSLSLYAASGALAVAYPELEALVGREGEGTVPDAWTGALLAGDFLSPHRPLLRLATLLMDVGVAEDVPEHREGVGTGADVDGREAPEGVRARAARRSAALLTRLRFSNADVDRVVSLVRVGPDLPGHDVAAADRRRWLAAAGADRVPDLVRIAGARARLRKAAGVEGAVEEAASRAREVRSELGRRPPLTVGAVALDGRDLIRMGLRPGPRFGRILAALLERVLEDPSLNQPETLARLVREDVAQDLFTGKNGKGTANGGSRRRGT